MIKWFALLLIFNASILKGFSQVPTTDIYLLDMKVKHGKYVFTNPKKISGWKGYNNQPYFTPDGESIYYVSYRNKQSDIYKYDIGSKTTTQFTNTPEDEYSPKLTPDGKYISVVRVMKDSAQQLWEFPLGGGEPKHLLQGADSIGYYCWQKGTVVMANVPEPMKLQIRDTQIMYSPKKMGDIHNVSPSENISKNAGRSLQLLDKKGKYVLFIQKPSDKKDSINWICILANRNVTAKLIATLPNCEDFALGPKNTLFMGKNGKMYKYRIGKDKDWIEIADFSNTEYKNFYRLAINVKGDKIALVSYFGKKP